MSKNRTDRKTKREKKMEFAEYQQQLAPYIFDFKTMASRCTASIDAFNAMVSKLPNGTVTQHGQQSLAFIDNGSDILGVAHLDATGTYPHFTHVQIGGPQGHEWVFSRWLDDRLGVFLLLDVLPRFANFDMLLTTGEETGQSSARFFKPPEGRQYRWMFEPDRMGDDVVHYQYNTPQLLAALRQAGFSGLSHGSFTDICHLEHLGVCGFNFGIGYTDNHSDWSRANLSQTLQQSARFLRFYETNQTVDFPWAPKPVAATTYGWPEGDTQPNHNYDRRWDNAKFKYNQIVRCSVDGHLWQVEGAPHKWGKATENQYWCRRPLDKNEPGRNVYGHYVGTASKDLDESTMVAELTAAEIEDAQILFDHPVFAQPTAPALIPDAETTLKELDNLESVNDGSKTKWMMLATLCCGPRSEDLTRRARRVYENKYFSPLIVQSHCDESPIPWPKLTPIYGLGQPIHTPFGQGKIDSLYPSIAYGEDVHWWVRYDVPDKDGLDCHLEPGSTLSSVSLPHVITDLTGI